MNINQVVSRPLFGATTALLPIATGVFAFAIVFPTAWHASVFVGFAGMSALCAWISVNDFRTHRVPNWSVYPLMLVGVVRAVTLLDVTFLLYWVVLFSLWQIRFMGGGDAKLLMGFFGLFPDFQLAWLIAVSILVTGVPYLAFKYRAKWRNIPRTLFFRLITRQFLPSQTEFEKEAVPFAFSFCLGWITYLVIFAVPR